MKISVVVPVYGCREALPELHRRISESVGRITPDYELILVNDCCPQKSWEIIEAICEKDFHTKGIEMSRNFGQMKAILAGLDYASGDWIIVMDCDLQDRPEEIPRLYQKAMEGYDVVFARRAKRKDGFLKIFLASIFYRIYRFATDGSYDGSVCNFSIVKRDVIRNYCKMREQHRGYVMYIRWLGFRQAVIDVEHSERYAGKSSYNLKRRIDTAIDLLTSQSDKILRVFASMGFAISFFSLLTIVGLIIYRCVADVSIGWTSLIATTVLMGGLTIMVMGIVGIYVGNIFIQVKERPLYVIRQCLNLEKEIDAEEKIES